MFGIKNKLWFFSNFSYHLQNSGLHKPPISKLCSNLCQNLNKPQVLKMFKLWRLSKGGNVFYSWLLAYQCFMALLGREHLNSPHPASEFSDRNNRTNLGLKFYKTLDFRKIWRNFNAEIFKSLGKFNYAVPLGQTFCPRFFKDMKNFLEN